MKKIRSYLFVIASLMILSEGALASSCIEEITRLTVGRNASQDTALMAALSAKSICEKSHPGAISCGMALHKVSIGSVKGTLEHVTNLKVSLQVCEYNSAQVVVCAMNRVRNDQSLGAYLRTNVQVLSSAVALCGGRAPKL